jgi:prolyl-tRNA editing enzyme YbaK/EbsC (Cys-tRNA(Pro) deacylase)
MQGEDDSRLDPMDVVLRRLAMHSVSAQILQHPPLFSMADVARLTTIPQAAQVKTVVLRLRNEDAATPVLCGLGADSRLDIRAVARLLGVARARLELVGSKELEAFAGMPPGAVSLVPVVRGTHVVLSARFADEEYLFFGAGRNDRTIEVRRAEFVRSFGVRVFQIER